MIPNSFFENIKNITPVIIKNYRPIMGAIAGAYILSKMLPNSLFEYMSWNKQGEGMDIHSNLLSAIERNTRSNIVAQPKKDNYIYSL